MLGEQGGDSKWEKREDKDQRCQNELFFFWRKTKNNKNKKIEPVQNILYWFKKFGTGSKIWYWFRKNCTKGKNWTTTFTVLIKTTLHLSVIG